MALQSLAGGLLRWPEAGEPTAASANATIDADGETIGAVWWNPVARTVRGFATVVTVVTAAGDLVFSLETVSGGLPTGTLIDANATVTVAVSATGLIKGTFPADVTMPVGFVAARIRRVSGTANVLLKRSVDYLRQFPAHVFEGTTLAAQNPACVFPFSGVPPSETYLRMPWGYVATNNAGMLTVTGVGAQRGCLVSLPFKARAVGLAFTGRQASTPASAPTVHLYSSNGTTELASGTCDLPVGAVDRCHFVPFGTSLDLEPGDYYLALQNNDASNAPAVASLSTQAGLTIEGTVDQTGIGTSLTRASAVSAWAEQANNWTPFNLVLDQLPDDTGTGGPPPVIITPPVFRATLINYPPNTPP